MRKLLSYGILLLMAWQIIGFVGYFEFSHYTLKKEIKKLLKQSVPSNELVVFEFHPYELEQLTWLKKNEFELDGNLFDVVRSHKTSEGNTYMECITDTQEKQLFATLGQGISSNLGDDHHHTPISIWMKILQLPVTSVSYPIQVPQFGMVENHKDGFHYNSIFSIANLRIDNPPPQES